MFCFVCFIFRQYIASFVTNTLPCIVHSTVVTTFKIEFSFSSNDLNELKRKEKRFLSVIRSVHHPPFRHISSNVEYITFCEFSAVPEIDVYAFVTLRECREVSIFTLLSGTGDVSAHVTSAPFRRSGLWGVVLGTLRVSLTWSWKNN